MATTQIVPQKPRPSPQDLIQSIGRNPYFEGNVFDKALQALGGKRNPSAAHLRESRRQIIAQMQAVRRGK